MPKPLEKVAEERFAVFCKKNGCIALKINPLSTRGLPDRMIIGPGRLIFFIEFKRQGEGPSKMQQHLADKLVGWHFDVYVCDTFEEAKKILMEKLIR